MKLDKKLPFFQVSGSEVGARWEQNGRQFDAAGDEIVTQAPATPAAVAAHAVRRGGPRKKEAEPAAPPPEASVAVDQVASQLAGA